MTKIECVAGDGVHLTGARLGDGPPLLLIHGGGGSHRSLLPLGELLADRFTVVLPDVRGYGGSVCRDPSAHGWGRYADDVVAWLDLLGLASAAIGGMSLGAAIAARVALDHPDRVEAVILASVHHGGAGTVTAEQVRQQQALADRFETEGVAAVLGPLFDSLPPGQAAEARAEAARIDVRSAAAALRGVADQEPFESIDELAAIRVPALVIPGDDGLHPRSLAERYGEVLPEATVVDVGGWDAGTTTESRAAALAPVITRFLAGVAEGEGPADGSVDTGVRRP